jgi:antitoxin MazE
MRPRVARWGNSLAVRIPKSVATQAQLHAGDDVEVRADSPGTVRIRAQKRRKTLAALVRQISTKNRHRESDWGAPRGNEIW